MCGINGFNFSNTHLIHAMNDVTHHRGPDDNGVFEGNAISLGNNRLAIIDLSPRGALPMWNVARTKVIVYNGEIYNYRELKKELDGYPFRTETDTEVILAAYEKWGEACLTRLNGIFAFAIWDTEKNELFLARDHIGVKPLYYFWDGRRFIFSSEIKAILCHDVPRRVDIAAANLYFHVLYVPSPYTMFEGIQKVPPAHFLRLQNGKLEKKEYWRVSDFENFKSCAEAKEHIRELFHDSIKHQLISDRPIGVFLSGGMDSTAVLGAAVREVGDHMKTYSVGFDVGESREKFNADMMLARKTAEHYRTDHHELVVSARDIRDNLESVAWHLDEPNFNPTAGAMFLLSRAAKKDVAVVLGGDGGDELFGGYPRYAASRLVSWACMQPAPLRTFFATALRKVGKETFASKLRCGSASLRALAFLSQKPELLSRIFTRDFLNDATVERHFEEMFFSKNEQAGDDFEKRFMDVDRQSWLVDESLLRTDKMTMAHGLEARVPILDRRLVEAANKIPTAWKLGRLPTPSLRAQGKKIWKEVIADYLPPHMRHEEKRGWFTPMAKWMRTDLRDFVSDILSAQNLRGGFLDAAGVEHILRDHLDGKRYNLNILWALVGWQLWYRRFIEPKS